MEAGHQRRKGGAGEIDGEDEPEKGEIDGIEGIGLRLLLRLSYFLYT